MLTHTNAWGRQRMNYYFFIFLSFQSLMIKLGEDCLIPNWKMENSETHARWQTTGNQTTLLQQCCMLFTLSHTNLSHISHLCSAQFGWHGFISDIIITSYCYNHNLCFLGSSSETQPDEKALFIHILNGQEDSSLSVDHSWSLMFSP